MKTLLASLLISTAALAAPTRGEVKDFNFNYSDPKGSGSASVFQMSDSLLQNGVQVEVEKKDSVFLINVSGSHYQSFEFKDAPDIAKNAKDMSIEGFNLSLKDALSLSVVEATFDSDKDSLTLKNLTLNCARDATQKEVMDEVVSGCIQKMTLRSSQFSQSALMKFTESLARALSPKTKTARGGVTVKSLSANVNGGKYDLSADIKAQISGKIKSNGNLSYDASNGVLTIKINEVKLGILGVTGQVFNELKKNESDKFKVKQPYVYLTIK